MAEGGGLDHWGDILALLLYIGLTLGVAFWSICKPTRRSVKGYFLASNTATWWQIGLSLFASNISSEHFIGFAGSGAASGIAIVLFEWNAIFLILLLAWVFLPVYLLSGVFTLPEYLMRRFGGERLRILVSVVFILSTILVPADLYSGGIFIQQALGWNIYYGISLIVLLAAIYSVFGGLSTVLYTDAVQVVIMLGGAVVLSVMSFVKVGGLGALREKYMAAVADTVTWPNATLVYVNGHDNHTGVTYNDTSPGNQCGLPRPDAWHLFRDPVNADFPSVAVFLRMSIGAVFYWCAHQIIVQRTLAAKNLSHSKGGAVLAGALKVTTMFLMVLPGMVSRVLFTNEVACADPEVCTEVCGSPAGCSNIAYPRLVVGVLPVGLRGMMLAVMLSAVVSSLTSTYNSLATLVTLDLWVKVRPRAGDRELLVVGRLSVLLVIGVSVAWIPILQDAEGGQMIRYITAVFGYLGAPLSAVFLMAMLWPRTTEQGAFWGFLVAAVSGMVRFALDTVYRRPLCGQPDERPLVVAAVHPYYFTAVQVALGMAVSALVSCCTPARTKQQLAGLTFWTRNDPMTEEGEVEVELATMSKDRCGSPAALDVLPEQQHLDAQASPQECSDPETDVSARLREKCLQAVCGFQTKSAPKCSQQREPYSVRRARLREGRCAKLALNSLALALAAAILALFIYFR